MRLRNVFRSRSDADSTPSRNTPVYTVEPADQSAGSTVYTGVFRDGVESPSERDRKTSRNLIEHAGHAVYVTDTTGTIQYVNPPLTEHTGYEPADVLGETPAI
ncbi:hypothetical protein DJ71_12025, partial [Halorubrum sp. E3]